MTAAEFKQFENELADDPEKASAARTMKDLNDSLKRLGEDIAHEKVPDMLLDIIHRSRMPAEKG